MALQQLKSILLSRLFWACAFSATTVVAFLWGGCESNGPAGNHSEKRIEAERGNLGKLRKDQLIEGFERSDIQVIMAESGEKVLTAFSPIQNDAATSQAASAPATQSTTQAAGFARTTARPADGLWAYEGKRAVASRGVWVFKKFEQAQDWTGVDTLRATVMVDGAGSGVYAAAFVVRADGRVLLGDGIGLSNKWRDVVLDLKGGDGVAMAAGMGVVYWTRHDEAAEDAAVTLRTDAWRVGADRHEYVGTRGGKNNAFYVEREGAQLHVGLVGAYELTLHQRSTVPMAGIVQGLGAALLPRGTNWHELRKGPGGIDRVIGGERAGLMLLDQGGFDAMGKIEHTTARTGGADVQVKPWLSAESEWTWQVVWTSPVGAQIEVRQVAGPYDAVGQPQAELLWRLMIYQWGQMYVRVEQRRIKGEISEPVTWALVTGEVRPAMQEDGKLQRLLAGMYTRDALAGVGDGGALPHEMQAGVGAALIAKAAVAGEKNVFWQRDLNGGRKVFGVGLPARVRKGGLDCMVLLNQTNELVQAGSFSGYLSPPRLRMRQGEADRAFPGENDNDGLVEAYGFQVVRLAKGRASFVIDPGKGVGGERAVFYPAVLFTVPADERELVDLKNSRVLINVDGKQFADPPRWPDGSFLLQLPFVLERPVTVEAVVVGRTTDR